MTTDYPYRRDRAFDSELLLDLTAVRKKLAAGEVIFIFFPLLRKALLIDTRHTDDEGPLIRIAPIVSSTEDRLRFLQRMRPHFSRPKRIAAISWPKYVESLLLLGLWDVVAKRLRATGHDDAVERGLRVLKELRQLEHREVVAAIKGQHYETLWPPTRGASGG